jgi:hypothetical protein
MSARVRRRAVLTGALAAGAPYRLAADVWGGFKTADTIIRGSANEAVAGVEDGLDNLDGGFRSHRS